MAEKKTAGTDKTQQDKDTKVAGKDESKTLETTKTAEEREVDTKVAERGETDAKGAASGSVVGGVVDGDTGLDSNDDDDKGDEVLALSDEVEGALGVVAERNVEGKEFDAPYTYLTAADVKPRTSDSDDGDVVKWTAQHAGGERQDEDGNDLDPVALVEVQGTPGQTFRVRELPNREVVEAAGINYEQWVAGLPVRADVPDEAPRRGIPA